MSGNTISTITLGAVAIAAVGFAYFGSSTNVLPISEREAIVVEGLGNVSAPHDYAAFNFTVETYAPSPAQALQENNTLMSNVLEQINNLEITPDDIETKRVRITSGNRWERYDNALEGSELQYTATNEVRLRFTNVDGVGPAMTAAVNGGATHINGPRMHLFETDELLAQARDRAIADAQRRAEEVAEAAGVTLGRIVRIENVEYQMTESDFHEYGAGIDEYLQQSSDRLVEDPTPVRYGTELLSARIQVHFEIE